MRSLVAILGIASLLGACGCSKPLTKSPLSDAGRDGPLDGSDSLPADTEQSVQDSTGPDLAASEPDVVRLEAGKDLADDTRPDASPDTPPASLVEVGQDLADEARLDANLDTGEPNPTRPDSSTSNAVLYFTDENGTWSVTSDTQPKLFVDHGGKAGLYPSPFLDRLAITRQGQGTEIYDRQGGLLGWIPSDLFTGWASNETVVVGMAKWDVQGQSVRAFATPQVAPNAVGSYVVGKGAVSPDGRWLAVEDIADPTKWGIFLTATNDGSKYWKVTDANGVDLFWSRGGSSLALFEDGVAALNADLTGTTKLTFPAVGQICAGQAWISDTTFLVWRVKMPLGSDVGYCADPYLVDATNAAATSFVPQTTMVGSSSAWDARTSVPIVVSPDGTQIAYASGTSNKGIVIARPDGTNPRTVAAGRTILSLAWDSANPKALAHDADKASTPKPDAGTVTTDALPGPSGKPSTSTDCTKGVWYRRSPSPLPTNWPEPRSSAAHAFDRDRGLLVLDGGYDSISRSTVAPSDTTWEWDGGAGTWTNRSPTTVPRPLPRSGHGMAYDSSRKVLISTGGQDIWSYDPAPNRWALSTCQSSVGAVSVVLYDPTPDNFFLATRDHSATMLSLGTCNANPLILPTPPNFYSIQSGVGYAFDSQRKTIWQFGGRNFGSTPLDAKAGWTLHPEDPNGPGLREYMALAFDEDRGHLMMFSGMKFLRAQVTSSSEISNPADLWEWNPDNSTWTVCGSGSPGPTPRTNANLAYDPTRHALILFGGEGYDDKGSSTGSQADLWEWAIP